LGERLDRTQEAAGSSPASSTVEVWAGVARLLSSRECEAGTTPSSCPDLAKRDDERMDWKLELITVPVSDVDRAKAFYRPAPSLSAHPRF
jgi:hypothetical protein